MKKLNNTSNTTSTYFYDDLRPKGLSDEALAKSEAIGNQSPTHLSAKKYDSLKSYFYDGDGLRVSRTDNLTGLITYYVWDSENPTGYPQVVEEIENNQVVRRYGYGLFLENVDIWNGTSFERFYVVRDGTNSVRMLLDSTGNVAATYDHDAFGNILSATNANPLTAGNPYQFHSEYKDPATNLVYLRARWYEPREGRFLCKDEFEGTQEQPMTLNKYASFNNNPINVIDPSGNEGIIGPTGSRISELLKGIVVKFKENAIIVSARALNLVGIQKKVVGDTRHAYIIIREKNKLDVLLEGASTNTTRGYGNLHGLYTRWGLLVKSASTKPASSVEYSPESTEIENPFGDSENGFKIFKDKVLNTFNSYKNNVKYRMLPTQGESGNSNSLIGSVVRKVGVNSFIMYGATGWEVDVIGGVQNQ